MHVDAPSASSRRKSACFGARSTSSERAAFRTVQGVPALTCHRCHKPRATASRSEPELRETSGVLVQGSASWVQCRVLRRGFSAGLYSCERVGHEREFGVARGSGAWGKVSWLSIYQDNTAGYESRLMEWNESKEKHDERDDAQVDEEQRALALKTLIERMRSEDMQCLIEVIHGLGIAHGAFHCLASVDRATATHLLEPGVCLR